MKNTLIYAFILIGFSCTLFDTGLTDLSPKDGHRSEWWFDTPDFIDAVENTENITPGIIHRIGKPKYLNTRVPDLIDTSWYVTDTFAFESKDYQAVVNSIVSTANQDWSPNRLIPSYQVNLMWLNWNGRRAYGGPGYYLYQIGNVWIRIDRTKDVERSNWFISAYRYSAFGIWLIGEREEKEGEVS